MDFLFAFLSAVSWFKQYMYYVIKFALDLVFAMYTICIQGKQNSIELLRWKKGPIKAL